MRLKVRELVPLHSEQVSGERPRLRALTDAELLRACERPLDGGRMIVNTHSGLLMNGNGRAYELKRRAELAESTITWDTEVTVEPYVPDKSMFSE